MGLSELVCGYVKEGRGSYSQGIDLLCDVY